MDVVKEEEKVAGVSEEDGVRWRQMIDCDHPLKRIAQMKRREKKMKVKKWGPEGSFGTWLWYRCPHGAEEARGTQEPGWTVHW